MNPPLVSIVVTTYNRPELLAACLKSIWEQAYPHVEAIVVNDGGVDVSEVCKRWEARLIDLPENRGFIHALNAGIAEAKGEIIGQIADDDSLYNNHIHVLMMELLKEKAPAAHSGFRIRYEQQVDGEWRTFGFNDQTYSFPFDRGQAYMGGNIALPSLLCRREIYEERGPFDEDCAFSDLDLITFVGTKYPIATVPIFTGEILTRVGGDHWGRKHCTGEEGVVEIRKLWAKYPIDDPTICKAREGVEKFLRSIDPKAPFIFGPTRMVA